MRITINSARLIGSTWHPAGANVDLPDDRAKSLIERGQATEATTAPTPAAATPAPAATPKPVKKAAKKKAVKDV